MQNGVWFVATSAIGPWAVATSVPVVIYTIPVSSPVHYVTYVKIYGSTPEVYGQWGNVAYAGTKAAWANPYTGNVGRGGAYAGVNTATGARYAGQAVRSPTPTPATLWQAQEALPTIQIQVLLAGVWVK